MAEKQALLLEYLVSSPDTFALCKSITEPEYFNPEFRKTVEFMHEYYDKYNSIPDVDQIKAETGLSLQTREVTKDQVRYCSDEIETFCRRKAIERAVLSSPPLIEAGKYGELEQSVRDALSVSLNSDLGIDYFSNPQERLERMLAQAPRTTTTWPAFDDMIGGGLARTELLLFSANSGGGKSIVLANLALNYAKQGLNVLYISLELSEDMIAQRLDMMLTSIPTVVWRENYKKICAAVNKAAPDMGKLVIKRMETGTNANAIRGYLKEFELKHGFVPDMLVVDYLDIMGANENVSADNVFEKDKRAAEQLRDILFDYNMFGASASQQNRSAIDATEVHQGHIAGGISKVNTVDIYCSILLTPVMKAAGEIGFTFLKTRSSDGVGKTMFLQWDAKSLCVINPEDGQVRIVNAADKANESEPATDAPKKRSLTDLLLT